MRLILVIACLLTVLGVAACAPQGAGASRTGAASPGTASATQGVILSMRTVTAPDGGNKLQAVLLADANGGAASDNRWQTPAYGIHRAAG